MLGEEEAGPLLKFPRRQVRVFERLLEQLHEQGLTWLTVNDVISNLDAVAVWSMERNRTVEKWHYDPDAGSLESTPRLQKPSELDAHLDLQDLCAQAGWPLPLEDGGRDHTTPAALAVHRARQRLTQAMLADSIEQRVSANTIADRARNAQSRPTTLKDLAAELLQHDAVQALRPLFEADVPIYLFKNVRSVQLSASWEDEPDEVRLGHLEDAQNALAAARLQLHDTDSGEPADIRRLAASKAKALEVRRT